MKATIRKKRTEVIGKRQFQSMQTKQSIFDVANVLFKEKGINQVGISDIVKHANVSVGTFYLYFSSKEDILFELFMGGEQTITEIQEALKDKHGSEYIIARFVKSAEHLEKAGVEIITQLFYPSNLLKHYISREQLVDAISDAQKNGEVSNDLGADEIALYLHCLSSGAIFEWCMGNGNFNLSHKIEQYLIHALKTL